MAAASPSSAPAEQAFTFGCDNEHLVGVLHLPTEDTSRAQIGVLIVVGGPQYRAGSHRQFVLLARALATAGHSVLRFDTRGMGDGSGAQRSFEQFDDDIAAAVDELLRRSPTVRRVVLWGLCDGASAALLYLHGRRDPRVSGLCLANPWVRSEQTLAQTQVKHYYTRRLREKGFWLKLLRGGVGLGALRGLGRTLQTARRNGSRAHPETGAASIADYRQRMLGAWQGFAGPVLLILSGEDLTAREFCEYSTANPDWMRLLRSDSLKREDLLGLDHTFSSAAARDRVAELTASWLATAFGTPGPAAAAQRG